jgi:hypothetical protein
MDDDETADARKEGVAYMYIILAGICFCATIFMILFVPETKGTRQSSAPSLGLIDACIISLCLCLSLPLSPPLSLPLSASPLLGKSPEDFITEVTHYKGEKVGKHEGDLARPLTTDFDGSSGKSY